MFLSKSRKFFDILLQNDLIETNQFCHQMELKVNKPWLVLIEKKKIKITVSPSAVYSEAEAVPLEWCQ